MYRELRWNAAYKQEVSISELGQPLNPDEVGRVLQWLRVTMEGLPRWERPPKSSYFQDKQDFLDTICRLVKRREAEGYDITAESTAAELMGTRFQSLEHDSAVRTLKRCARRFGY